jgi:hypothetical protein
MQTHTYERDNLLSGDFPLVTRAVTIASGQTLARGAILGNNGTAYVQADSTLVDGSEAAVAILAENVDATGGDTPAIAYLTGQFNERAVGVTGSDTAAGFRDALRAYSIFLEPSVSK